MPRRPHATEECPHCGTVFRAGRLACPECGSDANTGWKSADEIEYQSVEIPDYYDESPAKPSGWIPRWLFVAVAVLVVLSFLFAFVLGR